MRYALRIVVLGAVASLCLPPNPLIAFGSGDQGGDSVHIIPGIRYEAGWFHRFMLGSHWRDLWTTPVSIELLDLHRTGGGLTPIARGGGRETQSLHFKGHDGKSYKFRSIDKDPTLALTPELRHTIAADFAQDQISSANPFAALIAAPLLKAAGVLNADVRAVVLPDDSSLGEFRGEFAGKLGTIEENPTADPEGENGFGGAEKVIGTYSLYRRMQADNDERVDAPEFLKARLMDIYLGDWDRHADQWRWAGYKAGKKWTWKPIPRDRDQAFSRFDGLIPSIGDMMITEVESFEDHFKDIEDLTWTGRYLDRRFLTSLEKHTFDSISALITRSLTDSVIESAVHRPPREMYVKEGEWLETALKSRRDKLTEASDEFYRTLSRFAEIYGSDKSELAEIHRLDNGNVQIALFKIDKHTGEKKGEALFDRTFDQADTKDIRLHLLGGDDVAEVDGEVDNTIVVRVIGGDGQKEFIDNSIVHGKTLGLFPHAATRTFFYDCGNKAQCSLGPSASLNEDVPPAPANDTLLFEPPDRDYGHIWRFSPWYSYSREDGAFLGGGPIFYDYGFRANPYETRMELRGGYATGAKKIRIDFEGEFLSLVNGARVLVSAAGSGLEQLNYFGLGNETPIDENLRRDGYYDVPQTQIFVRPSISLSPASTLTLSAGGTIKYVKNKTEPGTLLDLVRPYGSQYTFVESAIFGSAEVDTRDNAKAPSGGTYMRIEGSFFPKTFDARDSFEKLRGEGRVYLSSDVLTRETLAMRIAGEKIWGAYPYFESSFIGGKGTVRGYESQRFGGDASVFGNAELRIHLGKFPILFPGSFGITAFGETGRVFVSGESSTRWHNAGGGGVWFWVIKPEYSLSVSVAHSPEKNGVYVSGGFTF